MLAFPNCKINIGLRILNRRPDGFHNISTIFYPLPFYDGLEIIPSQTLTLHLSGYPISGKIENNIVLQAYSLLKKDFPQLPKYEIHLHKNIPTGAGLGGGSADAAFMLTLLNRKAQLKLKKEQLLHYAAQLGSDCSFFIENTPSLASGRGEILEPVRLNHLKGYVLFIVCPDIHINTANAYQNIQPKPEIVPLKDLIKKPVATWKNQMKNDFEKDVLKKHPLLKNTKQKLYNSGAVYASLSGSGSTIYGLFSKEVDLSLLDFGDMFTKEFNL